MNNSILIISCASLDCYNDRILLGGPVSYGGRILDILSCNYMTIAKVGKDFLFGDYYKKNIKNSVIIKSNKCTLFFTSYKNGVRYQKVLSKSNKFKFEEIPKDLLNSRFILLSPIVDDMPLEFIKKMRKNTRSIICIDPFNNDNGKFSNKQRRYFIEVTKFADLIKISENELKGLFKDNIKRSLNKIRSFNNLFLITRGKKGVFIYKKDKVNKLFPIIKIKPIIDTTGCGDIFICAFLYGLSKRYKIDDCVLFGNVCAGLSVKGFGLDSLPNKDDIIKKFNEVKNVNF